LLQSPAKEYTNQNSVTTLIKPAQHVNRPFSRSWRSSNRGRSGQAFYRFWVCSGSG